MNVMLLIGLFAGLDLFFLRDSPDLLVRVLPEVESEHLVLYYSFSGTEWDSLTIEKQGRFFDATLRTPDNVRVVGVHGIYDNGAVEAVDGEPYLYEVKIFPKMLMPFAMTDLEVMLDQARKKIESGIHVDEAITLLGYVSEMLAVVPIKRGSPAELKRNLLQMEVDKLNSRLGR